jgi:hypothetical protein
VKAAAKGSDTPLLILSCAEDLKSVKGWKISAPVFAPELLLAGILKQSLDLSDSTHRLAGGVLGGAGGAGGGGCGGGKNDEDEGGDGSGGDGGRPNKRKADTAGDAAGTAKGAKAAKGGKEGALPAIRGGGR